MPDAFVARRCALPGIQAVEARSCRSFARHTHDGFGIGRIMSGAQRSWSGRGQVEAGAGDMITVNPGEVHDGAPIGDARSWKMLYFDPEAIAALASDIGEGGPGDFEFTQPVMASPAPAEAFEAAYHALADPQADPAFGEERLILLLAGLVRKRPRPSSPDDPALSKAKARIDENPAAPHALADLARLAGVSRFQMIRGFARLTGLTPHAYLIQRRLDEARQMMRKGAALADAAAACGFADQSHLTRAFGRRYGLTPGAYAASML